MNTITNFLKSTSLIFALVFTTSQAFATQNTGIEEITSFEIQSEAATVELIWQMAEDFEGKVLVQRAGIDMQFETISELDHAQINQFIDKQPQAGVTFYRLAIQHSDGSITYQKASSLSR